MKKLISLSLTVFALGCTLSLSAQEKQGADRLKHELTFGVANLFMKTNVWIIYDYPIDDPSFGPYVSDYLHHQQNLPYVVFGYKYHINNKIALRLHMNLLYNKHNDRLKPYDYHYLSFGSVIQLGLEWNKLFGKVKCYYGFDLLADIQRYDYERSPNAIGVYGYKKSDVNKEGWGIIPFIGAELFITPHFSIGTQTSVFLEKYNVKTMTEQHLGIPPNMDIEKDEYNSDGFNLGFGPSGFLFFNIYL